jgi:hypothetical protein
MKDECCETEECCETSGSCCESDSRHAMHHGSCGLSHNPTAMVSMMYHKVLLEMVKDRVKKKLEQTHTAKADKLADLVLEGIEGCKEMHAKMEKKSEWEKKVMEALME